MRVLLIEPTTYTPEGLVKQSTRPTQLISLTLPYLAALCPPEVQVDLCYDVCDDLEDYDLPSYDLVGITTQTIQMKRTIELASSIRRLGVRVVIGGPATVEDNSSLVPMLSRFSDSVVVGEADLLWPRLVDDALSGRGLERVYRSDELVPMNGQPLPKFDLVDFSKIEPPHVLPAITARGCPRRCTFCSEFLYSKWRYRPNDDVVSEILAYRDRFGIPNVVFRDDDFLVFPRRSKEMLTPLIGEGIEWGCQTDFNLARHLDVMDVAVSSGMKVASFGVESVREDNRKLTEKTFFTIPEAEDVLLRLNDAGVETQVNVIFGFDYDDPGVFEETYEFAIRTKVSRLFLSVLYPIPGTPLYEKLREEGRLREERPQGIDDPLAVTFDPKLMTDEQLVQGYLEVEREFAKVDKSDRNFWLGENLVVV